MRWVITDKSVVDIEDRSTVLEQVTMVDLPYVNKLVKRHNDVVDDILRNSGEESDCSYVYVGDLKAGDKFFMLSGMYVVTNAPVTLSAIPNSDVVTCVDISTGQVVGLIRNVKVIKLNIGYNLL